MAPGPITSWEIDRETEETVTDFIFGGTPKSLQMLAAAMKLKDTYSLEEKPTMINLESLLKSRDITNKGLSSQSYGFSSSHIWMWELDYKESWVPKNWGFWTVVLEKAHESPLDSKEIQPVHPKRNQSCIFIGRSDDEAETLILWLPDAKYWLIGKDPDSGKDWKCEEKGSTEDEMIGMYHRLNGHEFV